ISSSGADVRLPSPFAPAFTAEVGATVIGNASVDGVAGNPRASLPLFAFGPNAPLARELREGTSVDWPPVLRPTMSPCTA
uniref:hypothetical protein n=1 Tax=Enterobacter hormaechei TaxID=158836 RepID=UPI00203F4F8F